MSGIVLSSSVRQNLLSLQSTADLLATTQNRLATGKKVNSALDNPTNFFTASSLDSRASDISYLLDGVSNGVQVLQTPVGYSTRANVASAAITRNGVGVDGSDLRGLGTVTNTIKTGAVVNKGVTTVTITAADTLDALGTGGTALADADSISVNGKTITFNLANTVTTQTSSTDAFGNVTLFVKSAGTKAAVSDLLSAIDTAAGNTGTGSVASTVANSG